MRDPTKPRFGFRNGWNKPVECSSLQFSGATRCLRSDSSLCIADSSPRNQPWVEPRREERLVKRRHAVCEYTKAVPVYNILGSECVPATLPDAIRSTSQGACYVFRWLGSLGSMFIWLDYWLASASTGRICVKRKGRASPRGTCCTRVLWCTVALHWVARH